MRPRRLRRHERAAVYALLGTATEVAFTALQDAARPSTRSARLQGFTYLWMPPLYACLAVLFEPAHDRLREQPPLLRAAAYSAGIIAFEYASGRFIQRIAGVIPWDYTGRSPLQIHGATRLDYAPLWGAAGIALEPVDDALRSVRLSWAR